MATPFVIRNYDIFEPCFLSFRDNCIYGGAREDKDSYFMIQSPLCRVVSIDYVLGALRGLWIEVTSGFSNIILSIDIEFITHRSANIKQYLDSWKKFVPSIKPASSGPGCYLYINIRNFTHIYGGIKINDAVRLILNCNYTKESLIWNAYQIRNNIIELPETSDEDQDFVLEGCHLHAPELVKI